MLTSGCGLVRHWLQSWLWALAAALHNANFGPWACTALAAALAVGIGCSLLHNANFGLCRLVQHHAVFLRHWPVAALHNANFGLCRLVRHWLQPWLWALAAAFCITLTSGCAGLYNIMQFFLGIGLLQPCITLTSGCGGLCDTTQSLLGIGCKVCETATSVCTN